MAKCWEVRGCPPDILEACAVALAGARCVLNCRHAFCFSPNQKVSEGVQLMISGDNSKESKAVKQVCTTCEYFLSHAAGKKKVSKED